MSSNRTKTRGQGEGEIWRWGETVKRRQREAGRKEVLKLGSWEDGKRGKKFQMTREKKEVLKIGSWEDGKICVIYVPSL